MLKIESIEVSFFDNNRMSIPLPYQEGHYHKGNIQPRCHKCTFIINNKTYLLRKCQTKCKFGVEGGESKLTSYTKDFEFQEGEQLKGDVMIVPNYDDSTVTKHEDKGIAYLRFSTSYERVFEVGNVKFKSQDASHVFSANKSFMAGIFGQEYKNNSNITSLGFILFQKFDSESITEFEWPGYDDLKIETQEIKGKTKKTCNHNETVTKMKMIYPATEGNQRCTWLDHPFLEKKQINQLMELIPLPTVNEQGMHTFENVGKLPKDDRSFKKDRYVSRVELQPGQCAKLNYQTKVAKQDNLKFVFKKNQFKGNDLLLSFKFSGQTSMEKSVLDQVETLIEKDPTFNLDIEINPWYDYNEIKRNQRQEMHVGSRVGKAFSIQKENSTMQSLKVVFNESLEIIRSIHVTFQGDNELYSQPEGSDKLNWPILSGNQTKIFNFHQGEYLTGRVIMSENSKGTLSYIKFQTSLNRKFEAGKYMWFNNDQVFYLNKNFAAGIFGRASNVQTQVNSLGFILYKDQVQKEFKGLHWLPSNDKTISTRDEIHQTDKKCIDSTNDAQIDEFVADSSSDDSSSEQNDEQVNDSFDDNINPQPPNRPNSVTVLFNYQSIQGEERRVQVDGGQLAAVQIPKPFSVPYISDDCVQEERDVLEFESPKLSRQQVNQRSAVELGKCAMLKSTVKQGELLNQKFTITYDYVFENGHINRTTTHGNMDIKKVIDSKVEVILEEQSNKSSHVLEA